MSRSAMNRCEAGAVGPGFHLHFFSHVAVGAIDRWRSIPPKRPLQSRKKRTVFHWASPWTCRMSHLKLSTWALRLPSQWWRTWKHFQWWDYLAQVDAETRKRCAPQQGSEDGTTTATSESLCWPRALKESRWATSGGAGSLQDEEEKLRTKWVSRAVGILRQGSLVQKIRSKHCRH